MTHTDFAEWDAAYVLGALTPADRRDFEAHLATCAECRAAISELASLPGLLSRAEPWVDSADAMAEPPSNLVSLVEAREARDRAKARRRVWLVAAGAAAVLALGIGVPVGVLSSGGEPAADLVVAMEPVASTPLTASLSFDSVAWGTSISMTCEYPAGGAYPDAGSAAGTYTLVVTDTSGESQQVGTWAAVPGKTITLDAATSVPLDEIATVELRSSTGEVLLRAPVET
jgi:hypothetical protein